MVSNLRPFTKKEMKEIVRCYATAFPGWDIVHDFVFERRHGPVIQRVGIEPLECGPYRPWTALRTTPRPDVRMLFQFLDVKHREVFRREHPVKWREVLAAMEEQFRPAIRKPLDLWEIKELCEQKALPRTNDLCMLAILNAWLGEDERALACCDQMDDAELPPIAPSLEWERSRREFARKLRSAIEAGTAREFLQAASPVT